MGGGQGEEEKRGEGEEEMLAAFREMLADEAHTRTHAPKRQEGLCSWVELGGSEPGERSSKWTEPSPVLDGSERSRGAFKTFRPLFAPSR